MSALWIDLLRAACTDTSQRRVSRLIGYSHAVVSQVLKGTYSGDLKRVQAAVEGALMHGEVICPVVGAMPRQRCMAHQRRPLTNTNPMNIQLYRACRSGCAHSFLPQTIVPLDASAAQPAVASNTGSTGAAPSKNARRVTAPTDRRKRSPMTLEDDT